MVRSCREPSWSTFQSSNPIGQEILHNYVCISAKLTLTQPYPTNQIKSLKGTPVLWHAEQYRPQKDLISTPAVRLCACATAGTAD